MCVYRFWFSPFILFLRPHFHICSFVDFSFFCFDHKGWSIFVFSIFSLSVYASFHRSDEIGLVCWSVSECLILSWWMGAGLDAQMTALGNPDLLEHISYVKHEIRRLFRKLDTDHPRGLSCCLALLDMYQR